MTSHPELRIDGDRLLTRLHELRCIGADDDGGVTREAFGPEDVDARTLVETWMTEAGLEPFVDAAANLIGRHHGSTARWLASGSHLDTVVEGGWLDGSYGVVAALEVATVLAEAGVTLDHGLTVVAFSNEEGARGTPGMTGSRALIADVAQAELDEPDDGAVTLRQRIESAGGRPGDIASAKWPAWVFDAFVELHIEQGPVLAANDATLGVVTAITGRQAIDIEIVGRANHAGTTPMHLRSDAMSAAAEVALVVEGLATSGATRVATVGHLSIQPNVRNVVAGRAVLSAEIRDEASDRLDAAVEALEGQIAEVAERRGVEITTVLGQRVEPTLVDPTILSTLRKSVEASGLPFVELPSGAGHDAQVLGAVIPMGMLFVPSAGGISHSPAEDTSPADLVAGAQALLDAIVALGAAPADRGALRR